MAIETLAITVGFVLWTVVVMSFGQRMGQDQSANSPFQSHKRLYENQFTLLDEPGEFRGLGIREMDHSIELLRVAEKDGEYYRSSMFALHDSDSIDEVADALSEYVCEQEREVE